jgi:hypothetical protein
MEALQKMIEDWPVIVQGALGSALFAFSVYILPKLFRPINHKLASLSTSSRISELNTEKVKLGLFKAKGGDKAIFAAPLLYRMSRPSLKAFIWLVLGMILGQVLGILSLVGYLGSVYYFFSALDVVSVYEYDGEPNDRLKEINDEIDSLKNV